MIGRAIFNQTPLPPNRLAPLPLGAVRPEGWLLEQLTMQAEALKGGVLKDFPAAFSDDPWLGGKGDDLERAPRLLDGLIHLAYTLQDETLKAASDRFVEAALSSQTSTGAFGPGEDGNWWPRMLMLRPLRAYFTATGDKRALLLMDRFFKYQLRALESDPLTEYAAARSKENMAAALWLYNLTGQKHLLTLCDKLRSQSLDWTNSLHIFPYIRPMARMRPWMELKRSREKEAPLTGANQSCFGRDFFLSEGESVAMGLSAPGLINLFKSGFKEVGAFKTGYAKLMKHHGVATGMFNADWHLAGGSPTQGASLRATSELMHSVETLIATGDEFGVELADILEKLAFGALPAAFAKDMTLRQALSRVNQPVCGPGFQGFYNADDQDQRFTPVGDDAANAGFARFVSSLWHATSDEGLAAVGYAPCKVSFVAGGTRARITVETAYPFDTQVKIHVAVKEAAEFPLYLRIPGWTNQAMVRLPEGELLSLRAGEDACVRRKWTGEETVSLDLPMEPRVTRWFHESAAVELGPLLMCLNPGETWNQDADGWTLSPVNPWNWALDGNEAMKAVIEPEKARAFKAGAPAARVLVKAAPLPEWTLEGAYAAQPPIAPEAAPTQVIELTPYGCANLRIAQFPVLKNET